MEPKPSDSNRIENIQPPRTVEQLERMIGIIDEEIVREGESITKEKLGRLTAKIGLLTKELAKLKGEPLTDGTTDNLFR